jgi:hypothetical protein
VADAFQLLELHVAAFNHGVESGEWEPMVENFAPDGELVFVGGTGRTLAGRYAIAEAYRESPPDDAISILEAAILGGDLVASWGWREAEGEKAGLLVITPFKATIQRLVVTLDPA